MLLIGNAWKVSALFVVTLGLCSRNKTEEPSVSSSDVAADMASAIPSASSEEVAELQRLANDAAAISSASPSDSPVAQ